MKINYINTELIYRRLLAESNTAKREAIFRQELIAPYEGVVNTFGGGDGLTQFAQWALYTPEAFSDGHRETIVSLLDTMSAHKAWQKTEQALKDAHRAFAPYESRIPLNTIQCGLFLADGKMMRRFNPLDRGYTGFGGVPGYVMVVYGEANEYNLYRLKGTTVHELHHNIRFALFPFTMNVTVGEYIIAEGLAESFAAELYGEDVVGYYVTDFNEAELATAKRVIGNALSVKGFNEVRGYIFGDVIAENMKLPKAGVPNYAGYAIGYRVVQHYLKRTGKTVPEATFVPAKEIIAESGFFI
ncbi:hypothetical protein HYR54_07395 [Candidatus Acetothermia bacterium]|nr:hypothetical protein [Candidatus Acetothermia bacterium]